MPTTSNFAESAFKFLHFPYDTLTIAFSENIMGFTLGKSYVFDF